MSAYVVDKTHIDALVTAGLQLPDHGRLRWYWPQPPLGTPRAALQHFHHELRSSDADRVGQVLFDTNATSVAYLYDEAAETLTYRFDALPGTVDPVIVLDALRGYEYQASEHPGWRTSEAHAFCEALRHEAIRSLPSNSNGFSITDADRGIFLLKALA